MEPEAARGLLAAMLDGARGRVPTQRIDFVSNGVIGAFAYDLKTAHRYGKEGTASAVRSGYGGLQGIGHHNFVVYGERSTVDDERVPFVHNLIGAHKANPLGGEFQEPVWSTMLSGNVFDLHFAIAGIGRIPAPSGRSPFCP
ncbi:MAG TPA: metallopeptidase TldD-related protein [Methanothrix sp.]|nr:metallopeptidase TldD-related protein [Methanothrix sp.]